MERQSPYRRKTQSALQVRTLVQKTIIRLWAAAWKKMVRRKRNGGRQIAGSQSSRYISPLHLCPQRR